MEKIQYVIVINFDKLNMVKLNNYRTLYKFLAFNSKILDM